MQSVPVGEGGTIMIKVGVGPAEPPKTTWEKRTRGALPGCPPQCSPRKAIRGCLRRGEENYSNCLKGPRFCWAAAFPGQEMAGEELPDATETLSAARGKVSSGRPEGPYAGRCPGWRARARAPKPRLSAPPNPRFWKVCASSPPVINCPTQGGICKPHIRNATGLK